MQPATDTVNTVFICTNFMIRVTSAQNPAIALLFSHI